MAEYLSALNIEDVVDVYIKLIQGKLPNSTPQEFIKRVQMLYQFKDNKDIKTQPFFYRQYAQYSMTQAINNTVLMFMNKKYGDVKYTPEFINSKTEEVMKYSHMHNLVQTDDFKQHVRNWFNGEDDQQYKYTVALGMVVQMIYTVGKFTSPFVDCQLNQFVNLVYCDYNSVNEAAKISCCLILKLFALFNNILACDSLFHNCTYNVAADYDEFIVKVKDSLTSITSIFFAGIRRISPTMTKAHNNQIQNETHVYNIIHEDYKFCFKLLSELVDKNNTLLISSMLQGTVEMVSPNNTIFTKLCQDTKIVVPQNLSQFSQNPYNYTYEWEGLNKHYSIIKTLLKTQMDKSGFGGGFGMQNTASMFGGGNSGFATKPNTTSQNNVMELLCTLGGQNSSGFGNMNQNKMSNSNSGFRPSSGFGQNVNMGGFGGTSTRGFNANNSGGFSAPRNFGFNNNNSRNNGFGGSNNNPFNSSRSGGGSGRGFGFANTNGFNTPNQQTSGRNVQQLLATLGQN